MSKTLTNEGFTERFERSAVYRGASNYIGKRLLALLEDIHGIGALLIITLAVGVTKFTTARAVIRPMIRHQLTRAGADLMPLVTFLSIALGLVVIGQSTLILSRYGAETYLGTVMVTVIVRELGPMLAALLVLARVGTANVVELGTARALGEVEALEALGIDPIHYLVVPRVIGLALAIFGLTVYLILFALLSGYLFAFLKGVSLRPNEYFRELANALMWQDFVLIALKTFAFGVLISLVTCFEGLAQRLRLDEVSRATTSAVGKCVVGVVLLDAIFIVVYLLV